MIPKTFNSKDIDKILYNETINQDKNRQEHLLEQYKLYVEMADRISSRRQNANSFFLSINTAIVAFSSYLQVGSFITIESNIYLWPVAVSGMFVSFLWFRLIRSYRDLNSAKFKVIHQIEELLPIKPYDAEWALIGHGKDSKLYLPFTHIEICIPWIFILIHLFVLLFILIK